MTKMTMRLEELDVTRLSEKGAGAALRRLYGSDTLLARLLNYLLDVGYASAEVLDSRFGEATQDLAARYGLIDLFDGWQSDGAIVGVEILCEPHALHGALRAIAAVPDDACANTSTDHV